MAKILSANNSLAILDGDCLHRAGMRAVLSARDASGQEMARLALLSRGPSPVARIIERQAGVSEADLVGLEVGCLD